MLRRLQDTEKLCLLLTVHRTNKLHADIYPPTTITRIYLRPHYYSCLVISLGAGQILALRYFRWVIAKDLSVPPLRNVSF